MVNELPPVTLELVRSVAKRIRYQPLPDLVGQTVSISSLDRLDHDLRKAVDFIPAEAELCTKLDSAAVAIAKYGILDVEYVCKGSRSACGRIRSRAFTPARVFAQEFTCRTGRSKRWGALFA